MIKIAFIINSLGAGGAERVVTELAAFFHGQHMDVSLITLSPPSKASFYPLHPGISVHYLGKTEEKPKTLLSRAYGILKKLKGIRQRIHHLKPHVIVSFMDLTNIATLMVTRGLHTPVIVCERNNPHDHRLPGVLNLLRQYFYRYAAAITVQTLSAKEFFSPTLQEKITIIPNGVKKAPLSLAPNHFSHKTIINVGRLDHQKDQATLIRAFARIHKKFPEWQVHLYGQGPNKQQLVQLIQDLDLTDKVILKGLTQDIWPVLSKASIFVFPSRYEGFPNALAEAMSLRLPVIATDAHGNRDIVSHGKNGLLFPVGNDEKLAAFLEQVISHPEEFKHLGSNAQQIAIQYKPDTILHQWKDLIASVLKKDA